jgi:ribosome-interacting GTPase 1
MSGQAERHAAKIAWDRPFVLERGSTVDDLAGAIHHELRRNLKYAVLRGACGKFGAQRVGRHHQPDDEDVVGLYA